jgi:hypothetical protein
MLIANSSRDQQTLCCIRRGGSRNTIRDTNGASQTRPYSRNHQNVDALHARSRSAGILRELSTLFSGLCALCVESFALASAPA